MPPEQTSVEPPVLAPKGISPSVALDLEVYLCRSANRIDLFGGKTDHVRELGAPAAVWLAVKATLDYLRNIAQVSVPNNNTLCNLIGVSASVFSGNLMKGWPGKQNPDLWIRNARKVLRHILIGRDETPKDAEPKTKREGDERPARRIHDFLFRGMERAGAVPPFFERERLHFGEPCSVTELRDELSHLIRRFERARELKQEKQAIVVWTSGGLNFFGDDMMATVGAATVEAQKAGLDVFFVFASDATSGDAGTNLTAFESRFGIEARKYNLAAPLYSGDVKVAIDGKFRECLHPSLRHLYLSIPNDDGGYDEVLYFVRAPFEHNEPRRLPIAIRANDRELAAFQECWNRLRDHTPEPASQMPKKVPKKG